MEMVRIHTSTSTGVPVFRRYQPALPACLLGLGFFIYALMEWKSPHV